jgi:ankyrin repeat protein
MASIKGHVEDVQSLVESRANISAQNNFGWTPPHYAAWYERIEIVEILVKRYPTAVDVQNNENFTALHLATFKCNLPIVRLLIGLSQLSLTSLTGWTSLNIAASTCQVTILSFMSVF